MFSCPVQLQRRSRPLRLVSVLQSLNENISYRVPAAKVPWTPRKYDSSIICSAQFLTGTIFIPKLPSVLMLTRFVELREVLLGRNTSHAPIGARRLPTDVAKFPPPVYVLIIGFYWV